jgi:ATP-binding cassette subfamily B protein
VKHELAALAWPEATLEQALGELARAAALPVLGRSEEPLPAPAANASPPELRIATCAARLGLEVLAVDSDHAELGALLERMAPALVRLDAEGHGGRYLAVLGSRRRHLALLTPELTRVRVPAAHVLAALTSGLDQLPLARIEAWLEQTGVKGRRARRARRALLALLYGERRVGPVWLLRPDPGSSFVHQLRDARVLRLGGTAAALSLLQVVLSLLGWLLLGRVALGGSIESAWLVAWSLSLFSVVPFQIASARLGGSALQCVAEKLKQRLLWGALRLPVSAVRSARPGRLQALVADCEALESAGPSSALAALPALISLLAAAWVLALGAGGLAHAALLLGWCVVVAGCLRREQAARRAWTSSRLTSSCSFVENVLGNRTRVVQQPPALWHGREDQELCGELATATRFDAAQVRLGVLPARGWLLVGFLGVVPALIEPATTVELALSLGGTMLAYAAFNLLAPALSQLSAALSSWQSASELYHAAACAAPAGRARLPALIAPDGGGPERDDAPREKSLTPLLHAAGLWFRHPCSEPVLRGAGLRLETGDYVLLDGASGGGKSTLAGLLVGLSAPERGHILIGGLDRATLGGQGWSRRIAGAPQFHENHVFSATLAFNLLMGRAWPPTESDRRDADAVCSALGLGPLLSKMPAGLEQVVGETGWQLSHGERSRLFLARALLQTDGIIVLDESLGALDPETARQVERAITRRCRAALVIAHP